MVDLSGECLCGGIEYAYRGPLGAIVHCHCSRCRRWHGAAYRTRAVALRQGFEWTRGEELLSLYDSTPRVTKTFCSRCGSSLITLYRQRHALIGLPLAAVRGELDRRPEFHIFAASKAPWTDICDGLPAYDELPPDPELLHALPGSDSPVRD